MMICEINMMIEPCAQPKIYGNLQSYASHVTSMSGVLYGRIQRNQDLPQQITLYFAFEDKAALDRYLDKQPGCLPDNLLQNFGSQVAANRRLFEVAEEYIAA